jgi:hypothetical protein
MKNLELNLGQAMNFWNDEHFKSFKKDLNDDNKRVGEIVELYMEKYPEEAKKLLEKPLPAVVKPKEVEETPIEKVLGRMYNWKQASAYNYAKEIKDFPEEALKKLEHLSEKFGNCGWQDGSIYDELRDTNFEVAKMLGYEYNEEKDYYLPIKS